MFFCIDGELVLKSGDDELKICSGESVFLAAFEKEVYATGVGKLARVYNL
ncbi:hypothetical protein AB6G07_21595 [Providencia stuartii]